MSSRGQEAVSDFVPDIQDRGLQYVGTARIAGPLVVVERVRDVGYDELVEVVGPDGRPRLGRILDVSDTAAVIQVFEGTEGLSNEATRVRFLGEPLRLPVSRRMLGRVFDGLGRPMDSGPEPLSADRRDINGLPINPQARQYPREFIQTGLSAIDGMNSLVRGQKLPIFSGSGLPHDCIVPPWASSTTSPTSSSGTSRTPAPWPARRCSSLWPTRPASSG
jgi:V/A-type H+-transporting ATPase subunit B